MRAIYIDVEPRAEARDYPDPTPEGRDVVVRIEAAGLCGTDLHLIYEKPWAAIAIAGHEGAGTVVATDKATTVKAGDRVFMMAFGTCGVCPMCEQGYFTYCQSDESYMHGFTRDGFQAQYVRIDERLLRILPEDISFEQGAVSMDPIGAPHHALKRIGAAEGHTVGVFGLGPMGLGGVAIAAQKGCRVIGIDPVGYRREIAIKMGATDAVDPTAGDVVEQIKELTGGEGIDRALECCGREDALNAALDLAKPFGHVAMIGENKAATISPSNQFNRKEVTLSGSTVFPMPEFDEIMAVHQNGLPMEHFVTHRFSLEDADEAYQLFASGQTGKVLFIPEH